MANKEAEIYMNKGQALHSQKKYDEAIESFNKAIELDPSNFDAFNDRGRAYDAKQEYDKAIDDYSTAIGINSRIAYVFNNRGNAYQKKNEPEYDKAIEDYCTTLKLDPKYANAYNGRAYTYAKIGKFFKALADYSEAIKLNPDYALPYENRGLTYIDIGKYDEAIEDFTKALSLDPNKYSTYLSRGDAYKDKGNYNMAAADYTEAIRLKPDCAEAYNSRGSAYIGANNDRAIQEYNEAIKLDDKYAIAYGNRGLAYSNKIEYDTALTEYNEALKINPKDEWTYYSRGNVFLKRGELEKAIDDFSMALKLNSKYSEAREKRDEAYDLKGESDDYSGFTAVKGKTYRRYKKKIDTLHLTVEVKKTIKDELEKLKQVNDVDSPNTPSDFSSTLNFLDTIIALPWDDPKPEQFNLKKAIDILEEDHYGLADVKNRIIEFLAVRKLKMDNKGAILCFAGPPGVGKTSMGKAIAKALGKPFYRFSIGGVNDVSAIRGGRRFYIGSAPGGIIQGLKNTGSKASVIMIDEIDKITTGRGQNGGDPSAVLLEVLDPEQNDTFRDEYLDVPFDLSNILFIATANYLDDIPEPLRDRMEIIEIPGYVDEEKLQIAKKYLIPKSLEKNGLDKDRVSYSDEAVLHIANAYEKQPGVRRLEQDLDKIHRKLALQVIEQQETEEGEIEKLKFIFDVQEVEKYLGKPMYTGIKNDMLQMVSRAGMAVGLGVSGSFGFPMLIETISVPGEEGYTITGNMKTVMKESAETAFSFARKFAIENNYRDRSWFKENHIHIHLPTANPKDGPSAGIAITTALMSLFKNKIVTGNIVMTGEITLTGQVLAIGALREKIIGAKNNNAEQIIFPKQNLRDLDETPDIVKEGLRFHPVERYEEVLALMLP